MFGQQTASDTRLENVIKMAERLYIVRRCHGFCIHWNIYVPCDDLPKRHFIMEIASRSDSCSDELLSHRSSTAAWAGSLSEALLSLTMPENTQSLYSSACCISVSRASSSVRPSISKSSRLRVPNFSCANQDRSLSTTANTSTAGSYLLYLPSPQGQSSLKSSVGMASISN